MIPEAIIRVRFLTREEGGRPTSITNDRYGCPIMVDGRGFDCRFVLPDVSHFELGKTYEIPVKFLDPDNALRVLKKATPIRLWEGKTVAVGTLIEIL